MIVQRWYNYRSLVLKELARAFFVLSFLFLPYATTHAVPVTNHVVINEIMANPVGGEREWVELYNPTDNTIDLSNWRIKNGSANFSNIFARGTTIDSHSFLLREATTITSSQLNNTMQTLILQDTNLTSVDSVTYTGIVQGKSYARTYDASGVWSMQTVPTKNATNGVKDETPPTIVLSGQTPLENQVVSETITVQVAVTDASDFAEVAIGVVDTGQAGQGMICHDTSPTVGMRSCSIQTSVLPAGLHTIFVSATDTEGNQSTIERPIIVDNSAPTQTITLPGTQAHGIITVHVDTIESHLQTANIRVIDSQGNEVDIGMLSTENSFHYVWDSSGLNGLYTFETSAVDVVGHSVTASSSIVVDNIKPNASFDALPTVVGGATNTLQVNGAVSDDLPGASYTLSIDGIVISGVNDSPFTYNWDVDTLASGRYEVELTAEDAAGNTTTHSQVVFVDNTPPKVVVYVPFVNANTLTGTINEDRPIILTVGITKLAVTVSNTLNSSGRYEWTATIPQSLVNGTYAVDATASDEQGNMSLATADGASTTLVLDRFMSIPTIEIVPLTLLTGVTPLSVVGGVSPSSISIRAGVSVEAIIGDMSEIIDPAEVLAASTQANAKSPPVAQGVTWYWWAGGLIGVMAGGAWLWSRRH